MNANELTVVSVGFKYIDIHVHICGCINELAFLPVLFNFFFLF